MKRINENEIMQAIRDLKDEAYERFGNDVEIYVDTMISEGEALSVKVAWASIGTQTPEDAVTFASKILEAAEMARAFPYNGAVLMPAEIDKEGYEDYWYEMEEDEGEDEEQKTEERRAYSRGELEAFLNWEEDEYDIDGIMAEVTSIDPVTGDRYWLDEFVDDEDELFEVCMHYHKDDDDEEDDDVDEEQEESEHMDDIMSEIATSRRPWQRDTISEEWNGNGYDRLIIDISYDPHIDENGSAWRYKVHPDYDLEDRFDGAGYAEALSEKLEQDYAATDGDKIATAIAMARISEICHDYEDIKAGRPSAPSKRQMADIWAEAMGLELIEDVQTGPWDEALWAEGYLAKYKILVMYNSNFNGEEV